MIFSQKSIFCYAIPAWHESISWTNLQNDPNSRKFFNLSLFSWALQKSTCFFFWLPANLKYFRRPLGVLQANLTHFWFPQKSTFFFVKSSVWQLIWRIFVKLLVSSNIHISFREIIYLPANLTHFRRPLGLCFHITFPASMLKDCSCQDLVFT